MYKRQRVALNAGLVGTFTAWISDENISAAARFLDPGPFYNVSRNTLIFDKNPSMALPLVAIPDENGAVGALRLVWTGSSPAGAKANACDSWTGGGSMGTMGNANAAGAGSWANSAVTSCANARRLYCFER